MTTVTVSILVIGRGGEQISRLQSESGCKIQMAPDSGGLPERVCTLTGNAQAIRYSFVYEIHSCGSVFCNLT